MHPFSQTRGGELPPSFTLKESILNPQACFGGLYTLKSLLSLPALESLLPLSYTQLAQEIFALLQIQCPELTQSLQTYQHFDCPLNPAPVVSLNERFYFQELYHGPSRAFKDMALQPLGKLFSLFAGEEDHLILSATSGDTGPATLESLKGLKHIKVVCLYPSEGTSDVQRLQMSTQRADNLKVIPLIGNFDDAQHTLKSLLQDQKWKTHLQEHQIHLSVANSVNLGRILFQIIYHIWGYLSLLKDGVIKQKEKISIVIPSGNFGNALGAFYAKLMGVPFEKIVIASNPNHILTDFIHTGEYDLTQRTLLQSYSPAMDILKSSNVERVLHTLFGATRTKELMECLDKHSRYTLHDQELALVRSFFDAGFCSNPQCLQSIQEVCAMGKIIDPHTANAYHVAKSLQGVVLISSTAEWSKFSPTLVYALSGKMLNDQEALQWMCKEFNLPISPSIASLFEKPEQISQAITPKEVKNEILRWLEI